MMNSGIVPQSPWKSSSMSSETKRAYLTLYSKLPHRTNHVPARPIRKRLPPEDFKIELPQCMKFYTPTKPAFNYMELEGKPILTAKHSNRTEIIHHLGSNRQEAAKSEHWNTNRVRPLHPASPAECGSVASTNQRRKSLFLMVTSKLPQRKASAERTRPSSVDCRRGVHP